ncbi:TetR/AcrR family transcriptional regulator [Streptomyces sp. ME19-01-6]|uniref:TetR/AcrR family transcriptional regulator n=1 Tax=Streptomyces sp. ME19-01-6 TaxID=3028686 RepID=UPI0029A4BF4E|nr:TetR family transcriptional regulator [Streptomyces sp. ME19-01-6]MDX3230440.1 TetR family transcriptional regulator [Streptomyces sp. ME19-01-6]
MTSAQTGEASGPERKKRRSPAPGERQRDAERTKERILEAAMEEFSAKGPAGARLSAIARRAGVNQQLISYYFDGKDGLYREMGKQWRAHEAEAFPDDMPVAEMLKGYVRASVGHHRGGRLLAWDGLADTGPDDEDPEEARERNARLQQEVEAIRARQRAGELDDSIDPAALMLITFGAGNALAVYPHIARGLFGTDASSPELVERYADEVARLFARLAGGSDPR